MINLCLFDFVVAYYIAITMVRSRKRKTTRGETPPAVMLSAVKEALEGQLSVRAVGRKYDIDHAILLRYCNKYKSTQLQSTSSGEVMFLRISLLATVSQ